MPNLKHLELSFEEKKFLNDDFKRFEVDCLKRLKKMTSFYDKFRVIYGKSKHGLVFVSADTSTPEKIDFDGSLLQCFGRIRNEDKRPKASITLSSFSTSPSVNYKFFDFVSILKFDKKLIDEINSTLSDLKELVSFITTNHLAYALNCGKGYLPYSKRDGKRYMLTSRKAQIQKEKSIIKSIAMKNLDKFYLPRVEHIVTNNYNNPKIAESLDKERITNVIIPKDTKRTGS